jgi:hypothetical protein
MKLNGAKTLGVRRLVSDKEVRAYAGNKRKKLGDVQRRTRGSASLPPPLVVGRFLDLIKPPPGELGDGATDDKHDCGCGSAGLLSLQKLRFLFSNSGQMTI